MDQTLKATTLNKLTKADTVGIYVAKNSGFDGLAAGLSIYQSIKKLGKNSFILAKSPTVDDAQQLYGVDKIGKANVKNNLMIAIDNAVKNVDKVTYFLDGTRLKIVVHNLAGSAGVKKEEISFEESTSSPNILFTIGFSSWDDVRREITHEGNIDPNTLLVSVNKEGTSMKFAQVNIGSEVTSYSEAAARLLADLALPVNEDISFNLYKGISEATGHFSPSRVSPTTFEIASWLLKFGAGKASFAQGISSNGVNDPSSGLGVEDEKASGKVQQFSSLDSDTDLTSVEDVERERQSPEDWLKPPKVYKGSKSFDSEF